MALTFGRLTDIQQVADTAGSIYSNPASTTTYVRGLALHNTNTTNETVKVYNVPDSTGSLGTAGDSNRFICIILEPNQTAFFDLVYPFVLSDENDSIQAETTTASKVTVQVQGSIDV